MSLYNKIRAVNTLLNKASKDVQSFAEYTAVSCVTGCFKCCIKNMYASELEFYPLAYHLYKTKQAEKYLEKYYANNQKKSPCLMFDPLPFENVYGCSQYENRGLVCRLFGYSFNTDKNGDYKFATCKPLKSKYKTRLDEITNAEIIKPEMKNYYARLYAIDYNLADEILPMNEAIIKAIEKVLFNYEIRYKRKKI